MSVAMPEKLSAAQIRMLTGRANSQDVTTILAIAGRGGRSEHGGATGTLLSLRTLALLDASNNITSTGRHQLALLAGYDWFCEPDTREKITTKQVGLLKHTLGIEWSFGRGKSSRHRSMYRNYFAGSAGHASAPDLDALVALGLMGREDHPDGGKHTNVTWWATSKGAGVALASVGWRP